MKKLIAIICMVSIVFTTTFSVFAQDILGMDKPIKEVDISVMLPNLPVEEMEPPVILPNLPVEEIEPPTIFPEIQENHVITGIYDKFEIPIYMIVGDKNHVLTDQLSDTAFGFVDYTDKETPSGEIICITWDIPDIDTSKERTYTISGEFEVPEGYILASEVSPYVEQKLVIQESEDFTDGIITKIQDSDRLSDLPPEVYMVGDEINTYRYPFVGATVNLNGIASDMNLSVSWEVAHGHTAYPDKYNFTGTIMPPKGCEFADNILTTIITPIIVEEHRMEEIAWVGDRATGDDGFFKSTSLIALGDESGFIDVKEEIEDRMQYIGCGTNDYTKGASLLVESIDFNQSDINKVGSYEAMVKLVLSEEDKKHFIISEELSTLTIPVYVTDPQEFRPYFSTAEDGQFKLKWLYPIPQNENIIVYCYKSPEGELSFDELQDVEWIDFSEEVWFQENSIELYRELLEQEIDYYFKLYAEDGYSNILHIRDSKDSVFSGDIGGNKDGGDIEEPDILPPIVQPPISSGNHSDDTIVEKLPPLEDGKNLLEILIEDGKSLLEILIEDSAPLLEVSVEVSKDISEPFTLINSTRYTMEEEDSHRIAENTSVPVDPILVNEKDIKDKTPDLPQREVVTNNYSKIYGSRIAIMKEQYGKYIPFSHNEITAHIPRELLDLTKDDFVKVEIEKVGENQFYFNISINDEPIDILKDILISYQIKNEKVNSVYYEEEKIDTVVTLNQGYAEFSINKNGKYTLIKEPEESIKAVTATPKLQTESNVKLPIIGGSVIIMLVSIGWGIKKKNRVSK